MVPCKGGGWQASKGWHRDDDHWMVRQDRSPHSAQNGPPSDMRL